MPYVYMMIHLGSPGVLWVLEIPNLHYIDMNYPKDIIDLCVPKTDARQECLPIFFTTVPY